MRNVRFVVLALVLASSSACAGNLKANLTTAVQAGETVSASAQQAEINVFQTGALPQLTPALHAKIQTVFAKVFQDEADASTALKAWSGSGAVPSSVLGLITDADTLWSTLSPLLNDAGVGKIVAPVQAWIKEVLAIANAVNAAIPPGLNQAMAMKVAQ